MSRAYFGELGYDTAMAIDEAEFDRPRCRRWPPTTQAAEASLGVHCDWNRHHPRAFAIGANWFWLSMLVSVLLAFILAPVMDLLIQLQPASRGLAAAVAVLLLLALITDWCTTPRTRPSFSSRISPNTHKGSGRKFRRSGCRRKTWERRTLAPQAKARRVSFQHQLGGRPHSRLRFRLAGLLAASFVPFLVYFMLSWQQHVRSATVMLFSLENRHTAYITLGLISAMIRSFMVGNLLIGLFLGPPSTIAFAILHVPFFYFIGFISGFLSLVPYLGVVLAMAPPIFVSVGHIDSGDAVVIVLTVLVCT